MVYAVDKLTICNNALLATGNQAVSVADDGSDEWTYVSNYYDRMLPKILVAHDWKFRLNIAPLERTGTSIYPGFEDMYALPDDCLQLREAYDARDAALIQPIDARTVSDVGINLPAMDYRVIGGQIHCICPAGAYALYVQNPSSIDTSGATVGFVEALTTAIEALLTRGFNEDVSGGMALKGLADKELADARFQDDTVEPRRIIMRSPMLERRRRRRNYGGSWGF